MLSVCSQVHKPRMLQSAPMRKVYSYQIACSLLLLYSVSSFAASKASPAKTAGQRLQQRIEGILNADPVAARAFWGIDVEDAAKGTVVYSQNAEKLFTPA